MNKTAATCGIKLWLHLELSARALTLSLWLYKNEYIKSTMKMADVLWKINGRANTRIEMKQVLTASQPNKKEKTSRMTSLKDNNLNKSNQR